MTTLDAMTTRRIAVLTAAAGLIAAALVTAAAAAAGDRGHAFPLSVAEAKDRAEARFQTLDADGSGELNADELAAADMPKHGRRVMRHHVGFHPPFDGKRPAPADMVELRADMDAELFEQLDVNGDGLLAREEFASDKMHEARMALVQTRMFEHLDKDGSGGVSRAELPDMSQWLVDMDTDGDGIVTREEAREHRHSRGKHRPDAEDEASAG